MPTQQSFLGASITSYTSRIGWGGDSSNLTVTLVEDKVRGDDFVPVPVGTPVKFSYLTDTGYSWKFNGLVRNYKYSRGQGGFIYTVFIEDPREILHGVQIILDGFSETVPVKNILNVYGYLENINFGHSDKNATGIPWKKIRDTIETLCDSGLPSPYGAGVYLRNNRYTIDLSELPEIDEEFRVGGSPQMSLMAFIEDVCQAGAHEFFVELLDPVAPGTDGIIKIRVVDRSKNPTPGLLTSYLSSVAGVVSSEAGLEFNNNVVGRFLVGPQIIDMFQQSRNFDQDAPLFASDVNIRPFWGFNDDFSLIQGNIFLNGAFSNESVFKVPCRHLRVDKLTEYYFSIEELRYAYESKDAWLSFLDTEKGTGNYPDTNPYVKPHEGKIKLISSSFTNKTNVNTVVPISLQKVNGDWIKHSVRAKQSDNLDLENRVYNFVKSYANEYYGKRFAVQLPDLKITREPESLVYRTSKIPAEAGFFLPVEWSGQQGYNALIAQNKLPHNYNRLMTDDGRFTPYVRYDDIAFLDFSEIPASEIVFNSGRTSIFMRTQVESAVTFGDIQSSGDPHAIVTLPGAVRKVAAQDQAGGVGTNFSSAITKLVRDGMESGLFPPNSDTNIMKKFGIDTLFGGKIAQAVMPNFFAIPLQDNENRYGPWWNIQANGFTEYEVDDTLAPWNFGGYDLLDKVAFAKVSNMNAAMCEAETGSLEVAGAPTFTMGEQIVSGGPYITDISVSIGPDGVKTTYSLSTWTPKLQKLSKAKLDRIDNAFKLATEANNRRKELTDKFVNRSFSHQDRSNSIEKFLLRLEKDKILGGTTSHGIFSGDCDIGYMSGIYPSSITPNCWVQPFYNFAAQLDEDVYRGKAAVSVDGLFRPFSTDPSGVNYGLPSFVNPTYSGSEPTVNELNPYRGRHDIVTVIRGSALPDHLCTLYDSGYYNETDYRSMALRGPLVVAGWGYDTEGYPIPNESGAPFNSGTRTQAFHPNYKQRQDLWPAGPVDMRFNRERGVWEAGGGTAAKIVRILHKSGTNFPVSFGKTYYSEIMSVDFTDGVGNAVKCSGTGDFMYVGNFRQNVVLESSIYVAFKMNGKYYLDNQSVFNFIG